MTTQTIDSNNPIENARLVFFVNILRDGAGMINREIGLATDMARRGADVTILSYFRPDKSLAEKLQAQGVKVKKIWRTGYYGFLYDSILMQPFLLLCIAWKLLWLRPDVVFVDLHQEANWTLWLRFLFRYRIVFTYHGVADSRFYTGRAARNLDRIRRISHRLLPRVDQAIVVSDFLLAETKSIGVDAIRLHNGVDRTRFHPKNRLQNINSTGPVVLFIGRYTEYKGAKNVLEAFVKTLREVPGAELIMHGYFESEAYIKSIYKIIEEEKIADRVHILGPLNGSEMPTRLGLATIFANGSVDETFCMPLLEAESCGIPCVAFAAGGIPEVVLDSKSGLLAPPEDIETYAKNMTRILKSKSLREELSNGALDHAETFTYDKLGDQLLDIITPFLPKRKDG